ncbi:M23 family metallopeptidase [Sphaerisporangium aureirubrum]|uniref:M23 family metallopeptidase n=1 Tax=Sphaerisporangium aureirubrum TaxID=1544736 RepID=A0ABW1NLA3_9ACTN
MSAASLLKRPLLIALAVVMAAAPFAGATPASAAATSSLSKSAAAARPAFQLPFPCGQQWRLDSWGHAPALDMTKEPNQAGTEGATLVAPAAGRVNQSFLHANAGNLIQIDHGGGWFTTYIHLQVRSVQVGANVTMGQMIGRVGHTGETSNGVPHVHVEQAFDANGNGSATWGVAGSERVVQMYNGASYGTANSQTFRNVTSNNTCGGTPPERYKYWVDTFADAPGRSTPGGTRTGTLLAGTNYVYCKVEGPVVSVGSAHNKWWLQTDLDTGNPWQNQYVSAYYLTRWGNDEARDNNGNTIRDCVF